MSRWCGCSDTEAPAAESSLPARLPLGDPLTSVRYAASFGTCHVVERAQTPTDAAALVAHSSAPKFATTLGRARSTITIALTVEYILALEETL